MSLPDMSEFIDPSAPPWMQEAIAEGIREGLKVARSYNSTHRFFKYQNDPIGFIETELQSKLTEDCKRVALSVRDHPVTVVRSATGVGKSHLASRLALWWFRCFLPSEVYMTAAPPIDNLKRILWGEMIDAIGHCPSAFSMYARRELFIGVMPPKGEIKKRTPKHWIYGTAIPTTGTREERVAKFSGKHSPHLLFIVDEGDAVPEEVYEGIDGCMSGGHIRLLVLFNPKAQSGPIYRMERDHVANVIELSALSHPNVTTGKDEIPGAVSREKTIQRINMWTRPLIEGEKSGEDDTFVVPEFLVGTVAEGADGIPFPPLQSGPRKITEPAFCYKVMGRYPMQGESQLISTEWIGNARARWDLYVAKYGEVPPPGTPGRMGQDVAEMGTDANVCILRWGGFVERPILWSGVDPDLTSDRALEIYLARRPEVAIVDGTSLGSGVAPAMVRKGRRSGHNDVRAIGVKASEKPSLTIKSEIGEFQYIRDQLWWAVREWLRTDPGAMLPPDGQLMEELKTPTYHVKVTNGKVTITDKDTLRNLLHRSPDRADALCLTFMPAIRAKVVRLIDG